MTKSSPKHHGYYPKATISATIEQWHRLILDREAEREGVSTSHVLRKILDRYLDEEYGGVPNPRAPKEFEEVEL